MESAARALDAATTTDAAATWKVIVEAGWLGAGLPEEAGGLGLGAAAQGAIGLELGRALAPGPSVAATAALAALAAAPKSSRRTALIEEALGGALTTLSLADCAKGHARLVEAVPDADGPGVLLAFSADGAHAAVFGLNDPGLNARPRVLWDETRRLFDVSFGRASGETIAEGDAARAMQAAARTSIAVGLAADSLGGAAAILDRTIDYLGQRRQFDRPLAMFQALKHRAADLKTQLSLAEALFWRRLADPSASALDLDAMKVSACAVYRVVCEEAVQLHGGVGLTAEFYCHRYLKRALLNEALGHAPDAVEEDVGRALLGSAMPM